MSATATRAAEADDVRAAAAAAAGDLAAWDDLYRTHADGLRAYIRALDGADDVDDVFQTVWLQVVRDIGQLRDPATFPAWIRSIARHTTYRATRTHRRRQTATAGLLTAEPVDALSDPELLVLDAEDADRARRALADLPKRSRDLLTARVVDELTPADIAARSGLSTDSVHVSLTRGRKALRAAFERLPLLLPPGVWRVLRRIQDLGPTVGDTVVAVAALFLVVTAPAAAERTDDLPTATYHDTTSLTSVETRTAVRPSDDSVTIRPAPVPLGPSGRPTDASGVLVEADERYEEVLTVPAGDGPGVRYYDGDFSEHGRPDVYVDDGAGTEARFWVFDYLDADRPEEAPHIEVAPGQVDSAGSGTDDTVGITAGQ